MVDGALLYIRELDDHPGEMNRWIDGGRIIFCGNREEGREKEERETS